MIAASVSSQGRNASAPSGSSGIAQAKKPNPPTLYSVPATSAAPEGWFWRWKSISQECSGNSGSFTANAAARPANSQPCTTGSSARVAGSRSAKA